ncbi:CAP domain-containing protein [Defluviimonas sp. WL0050]|uniref:CAP domain-containing protein n=1 Tax=Albidovulum litorale TaxID=2984134 RepID=A0ABT2ZKH0_9RHOB|nr:CAP domain-containing protein [Defluviimonas sp. WL0050]MCV2871618.1 CAP domain-containing protein [Defluviimonas sp. WL0050]
MRNLAAKALLSAAIALTLAAGAAEACSRNMPKGAETMIKANARIDQGLADKAILAELNYHRCKKGLHELKQATGLRKVAGTHAKWMARSQQLSHRSTVAGQATAAARLKSSGIRFRAGSENIGYIARYQLDGRRFLIRDRANCGFATNGGQMIPPHSYASMARTIVDLWMGSPKHRRNILDRKVTQVGSAVGFDPRSEYCGRLYVSQSFAG